MLGMIFVHFNVSCFDNIILSGWFQCQQNFFYISLRNVFEFCILLLQKMGVFSPSFKILRHPHFLNPFETMIFRFYIQFAFQRYITLPSISQMKVVRFFLQKSQWWNEAYLCILNVVIWYFEPCPRCNLLILTSLPDILPLQPN